MSNDAIGTHDHLVEIKRLNQELLKHIKLNPEADLRNKFADYKKQIESLNGKSSLLLKPSFKQNGDSDQGEQQAVSDKDPTLPLITAIQLEINALHLDQRPSPELASEPNKTHISWNEYFMSVAQLAARRSKDPATQVGACIVNSQNKIVATGYNGMPNGVCDSIVPWRKVGPFLDTKYAYVVHAELNAILNCVLTDQTGCRIYVSLFPCNECAKAIIQSGIRHVIYLSDKHKDKDSTKAAKIMFEMVGVLCEPYGHRKN